MDSDSSIPSAVVCTGNAHKVRELDALLPGFRLEPLPSGTVLPPEIGDTFLDNARIKAYAGAAMFPGRWVIADDSGLLVDSLNGRPGVHSARFAGNDASDGDNVQLLLRELDPFHDPDLRAARFACVLVAISPDGTEYDAAGFVEGHIADAPSGDGGFGYDPVFVPRGHAASFAELGDEVKSRMSHRANAVAVLRTNLADVIG
jgi:XTP/dITP diphosphohydrolase